MTNGRGALTVVVGLVATLGVAAADASATERISADRVERFREYTVYSLGDAFQGWRLTARLFSRVPPAYGSGVTRVPSATSPMFAFLYGSCDPPRREGGCSPPVDIQNYAICARNPHSYPRRPRLIVLRGVPVGMFNDRLEVYTGKTTVVIFARRRTARSAVRALRGVNARVRLGSRLAAPVRGALDGRMRCAP